MKFPHRTLRLALLLFCLSMFFPMLGIAAVGDPGQGLVVCGNTTGDPCTFDKLIEEVQVVLNFLIFKVAAPLAAVMFAYAGFLYVTNAGNENRIKEAHEIFWNVFIGLVIALAAWLTINFILVFFLDAKFIFLT